MWFLRIKRSTFAVLTLALVSGCSSLHHKKTVVNEPPMIGDTSGLDGTPIVQAPEVRVSSAADRHPIITRPREYYDSTNGNKITRTAAAAVIGVPSGIGAEIKQIIVGQAPPR